MSLLAHFGLNRALELTAQHQSGEINRPCANYSRKYGNACQAFLKSQFPTILGFCSTLNIPGSSLDHWVPKNYMQIIHCRGNHWVTVTTLGCCEEVTVYNSLYTDVDPVTRSVIAGVFKCSHIRCVIPLVKKQCGWKDCGLYATAYATYLAYSNNRSGLSARHFHQNKLRDHFLNCLEQKCMLEFPCVL